MELRTANELLIQVRIATNPHLEPSEAQSLVDELMATRNKYMPPEIPQRPFDRRRFEELRALMGKSKRLRKT